VRPSPVATVVTACWLVVACATGCGEDVGKLEPNRTSIAQVGPACDALRASKDPERDAYGFLIDFVYEKVEDLRVRYGSLTTGQRMLYATLEVEDEVNNGGFNQYFFNTSGESLNDAIRGFETFGSRLHAKLARQARGIYAKDMQRIANAQADGTLEAFSESYDDEPYAALDSRLAELRSPPGRLAYLNAHIRQFCVS
jgi:hypothetical protein